jgi:hypothetical protein
MGFELLLFIYPFVKEKTKVLRYAQIGNLYTTFIFTIVTIVSIIFFGEMSLKQIIWPIFSMFKIVHLPNLERFEFIAVSIWMLLILPNMCAYLWAASHGFSRIMVKKQKHGMWLVAILTWGGTFFIQTRYQMNQVTDYVAKAGFICAYCYPFLLSVLVLVKKWLVRRRKTHAQEM